MSIILLNEKVDINIVLLYDSFMQKNLYIYLYLYLFLCLPLVRFIANLYL